MAAMRGHEDPVDRPDRPAVEQDAEFGPRGYLPPRAARRARKIVLRERMGLHWPVASVVAGVAILAVVVPLVLASSGPPDAPFVAAAPLEAVDPRGATVVEVEGREVLVVRGGGVLVAFADPPASLTYCPESRRLETTDGRVWSLQGVPLDGRSQPLLRVPALAYESEVYLALSDAAAAGGAAGDGVALEAACA